MPKRSGPTPRSTAKQSGSARAKPALANRPTNTPVESVAFVSLGCPKNLVDSEKMLGLLAEDGLAVVSADVGPGEAGGGADAIVINTCGFLEASKEESLSVIHDAIAAKARGEIKRVVVAGCLVQRHRAKMLEWAPGIDAMVGVFDRDHIVEAVRGEKRERRTLAQASDQPKYWIAGNALVAASDRGMKTTGLTVNGKDGSGIGYFEDDSARLRLTPRHYAYLRMSEGCNQNCAFCTIPSIRGKMRSKPLSAIATEAKELIADGAFELHLIGQDTTSYGDDIGLGMAARTGQGRTAQFSSGLPAVLKAVSDAFEFAGADGWVRLMYAYPTNFSDDIIDAFAELVPKSLGGGGHGRVLPYIDIPLQHASDRMLTAMRRNVSADHQLKLMKKLKTRIPGMAIRTTFISGFPGETEADHRQLLEFIEAVEFDALGVFEYSKEDGTVAGTMEADPRLAVPAEVKARRREEVMLLQQKLAFARTKAIADRFDEARPADTGTRFDVLIDAPTATRGRQTTGVTKAGKLYEGRTYFQAPQIDSVTYVHAQRPLAPGELVRCVIVAADGYDLIARPIDDLDKRVSLKVMR
jgi:ribosomal protein S12 methylthiotransferase